MRANVLSKQMLEPKMTGLSSQQFSHFLRSKVGKTLLGLFIFSAIQVAFGAMLPHAFSVAPNAAYALSVQEALPAGTEVSVEVDAVVVSFAQPMDVAQSLPAADLRIDGSAGVGFDLVNANWDMTGLVLTLPLTGELEWGTAYTVNIGGLNSALGIPMFFAHTHIFMTELHPRDGGTPRIVQLDAGVEHSVALFNDGTLWTWGSNASGQLGLGDTDQRMVPVLIDDAGIDGDEWTAFAAGYSHTLGIRDDGSLWAWGDNYYGQLGIIGGNQLSPALVGVVPTAPEYEWTAVAAGYSFSLALRGDGTLWSWGNNTFGQLGRINQASSSIPVLVDEVGAPNTYWTHFVAGDYHAIAARSDGTLWAWGISMGGLLGLPHVMGGVLTPTPIPLPAELNNVQWESLTAGSFYTLALCEEGTLWSWGHNSAGQLGVGNIIGPPGGSTAATQDIRQALQPVVVPTGDINDYWVAVSAGYIHTLGLLSDGTLWSWGFNNHGQLGLGDNTHRTAPTLIPEPVGFTASDEWIDFAAGFYHTIALSYSGDLYTWGSNEAAQLGKGAVGEVAGAANNAPWRMAAMIVTDDATTPEDGATDVTDGTIIIDFGRPMYTGEDSSNARTGAEAPGTITITIDDGNGGETVVQTIYADEGQWEDCGTIFTAQMNLTASDTEHTAEVKGFVDDFLRSEMHSHKWTFTTGEIKEPVKPSVQVVAGLNYTIALRDDGTLWGWGQNNYGQLGLGFAGLPIPIPTRMPNHDGISGDYWTAVSAGQRHAIALRDDGTLWAWGNNAFGRLGINTIGGAVNTPTEVGIPIGANGDKWIAVSAGENHTVALLNDGTLWAWGSNADGRLGIGHSGGNYAIPYQVEDGGLGVTGWINVFAGYHHTLAICNGGNLYAWGANSLAGRLGVGVGDSTPRNVPTAVDITNTSATGWVDVVAGDNHTLAICKDGNLYAWGGNGFGQLGAAGGTGGNRSIPGAVSVPTGASDTEWIAVSAGTHYSFALCSEGTLWAWGDNANGRLGIGHSGGSYATPRLVDAAGDIAGTSDSWNAIFSGHTHALAFCDRGILWSWGTNGAGQLGKGFAAPNTDNPTPWRIAASVDSTIPYDGEDDVVATTITITFDRPMRTELEHRGTITIDNRARVNVAAGTWSDCRTIFTAPLRLFVSEEVHEVKVEGFVDDFLGWKETNEMYPHEWEFTSGKIERISIFYDDSACATCHFTESIRLEHQFVQSRGIVTAADCDNAPYEYGCQKCHGQGFSDAEKINWGRLSDCTSFDPMYGVYDYGCMSCHNSGDTHVASETRMMESHALADPSNSGCAGSGCHGERGFNEFGFGFGVMDLASAHADYWLAVGDERVTYPPSPRSLEIQEESPFGCGVCHERGDIDSPYRLRSEIATHLEDAVTAVEPLTCLTCHVPPNVAPGSNGPPHPRRLHEDLEDALGIEPLATSATVTSLLRSLSAEVRAELGLELEGESLEPGVLPTCGARSISTTATAATVAFTPFNENCPVFNYDCPDDDCCLPCGICEICDPPTGAGNVPPIPPVPPIDCDDCDTDVCTCCIVCDYHPCRCCTTCRNHPCTCCTVCNYHPCRCCDTCEGHPCTCTTAAEETTPTAPPAERDPNAGPATGELNNWFAQIAVVALIVATVAATGLIRTRKEQI